HRSLPSFPTRRSSDLSCMTSVDVATSAGPLSLPGLGALGGFVIAAAIGYVLGAFEPRREQPVVAGSAMAVGSAVLLLALLAGPRSEEHTSELQSRENL